MDRHATLDRSEGAHDRAAQSDGASVFVRTDAQGAIDEDLYCLTCGYNLRGLSGDPVRCPECGKQNPLWMATIPAEAITQTLQNMETAPTTCCAAAFLAGLLLTWLASLSKKGDPTWILFGLLLMLVVWLGGYRRMKTVFENRTGWRRILLDFHLALLLGSAEFLLIIVVVWMGIHKLLGRHLFVMVAVLIVGAAALPLALRIYDAARGRLAVMQREGARRTARETLRRTLQRKRRGWQGDVWIPKEPAPGSPK